VLWGTVVSGGAEKKKSGMREECARFRRRSKVIFSPLQQYKERGGGGSTLSSKGAMQRRGEQSQRAERHAGNGKKGSAGLSLGGGGEGDGMRYSLVKKSPRKTAAAYAAKGREASMCGASEGESGITRGGGEVGERIRLFLEGGSISDRTRGDESRRGKTGELGRGRLKKRAGIETPWQKNLGVGSGHTGRTRTGR